MPREPAGFIPPISKGNPMSMTHQEIVAEARAQIKEADQAMAAKHLAEGGLIVDVREPAEYEAARLSGAINLPRGVIEFKIADNPALANKDARILLYCKTGGRSALATANLQRMGYTGLSSLAGGIDDWVKAGRTVVSGAAS
jgi:rhodanese-related sulfurtransferase